MKEVNTMEKRIYPNCHKPVYSADTISPTWTCPYCGKEIPAGTPDADELVAISRKEYDRLKKLESYVAKLFNVCKSHYCAKYKNCAECPVNKD
jgi:hypothetical protein